MMETIEKLRIEVSEIKKSLDDLQKNVKLPEKDKKKQAEELKSKAETTKQKIETKIDSLNEKTDDESMREKEEAEALLKSLDDITALYTSIISGSSKSGAKGEKKTEKKSFFKKAKEWVGEQWNDIRDEKKWDEEKGKNWLRVGGFAVTGLGAAALVVQGFKKLFGKKKKDSKIESEGGESEG